MVTTRPWSDQTTRNKIVQRFQREDQRRSTQGVWKQLRWHVGRPQNQLDETFKHSYGERNQWTNVKQHTFSKWLIDFTTTKKRDQTKYYISVKKNLPQLFYRMFRNFGIEFKLVVLITIVWILRLTNYLSFPNRI